MTAIQDRTILLVEDDMGHAHLMMKRLRRAGVTNEIIHVEDGYDAVALLDVDNHDLPGVVLLDLNIPGLSGTQVLEWMAANQSVSGIPTIVLTTSDRPEDMQACHVCEDYIIKPPDYNSLADRIRVLMS